MRPHGRCGTCRAILQCDRSAQQCRHSPRGRGLLRTSRLSPGWFQCQPVGARLRGTEHDLTNESKKVHPSCSDRVVFLAEDPLMLSFSLLMCVLSLGKGAMAMSAFHLPTCRMSRMLQRFQCGSHADRSHGTGSRSWSVVTCSVRLRHGSH